jgi:hypothetical protein
MHHKPTYNFIKQAEMGLALGSCFACLYFDNALAIKTILQENCIKKPTKPPKKKKKEKEKRKNGNSKAV